VATERYWSPTPLMDIHLIFSGLLSLYSIFSFPPGTAKSIGGSTKCRPVLLLVDGLLSYAPLSSGFFASTATPSGGVLLGF
jgi:hypothetical protein